MPFCNSSYYRLIEDQYYDILLPLSPVMRAAEKFRLALEEMPVQINPGDPFIGWFGPSEPIDTSAFRRLPQQILPTTEEQQLLAYPGTIGSPVCVDRAHTCIRYEQILREGLSSYANRVDTARENDPHNEYLDAMNITLKAVRAFTLRLERIVLEKAKDEDAYITLANRIHRVPWESAQDFTDALQAIWILHFLIPLAEDAWYSISLGRLDDYLLPYYRRSVANGMTDTEAKKQLHAFWKLLNGYSDAACLMNVGPEYNELSQLLMECQKEFGLPSPILGARIGKMTPDNDLLSLIDPKLFSMGQPTFYSEEGCRKTLLDRGIPQDEVNSFANNSCMAIGIPGKEFNSMWGCVLKVEVPLEMAITGGTLLGSWNGICAAEYGSFEELYNAFLGYCRDTLHQCLTAYDIRARLSAENEPDPFLTAILDDCIEKGMDRIYSAKYHNVTVECMGMVNVADGLSAIRKLVFEDHLLSLTDFANAVRSDFIQREDLRQKILSLPRFGMGREEDCMAYRVANSLADLISAHNHDNFCYLPSLHTLDANVHHGAGWGAGFDGRKAGVPFAKNEGPANEAREKDPTTVILSTSALPQCRFAGGQPLDLSFPPSLIESGKDRIAALVRIYLENGGLQLQVNGVSTEVLRDAVAHPELHEDLVVRIGGYSQYFNRFNHRTKIEFIERFEREEA